MGKEAPVGSLLPAICVLFFTFEQDGSKTLNRRGSWSCIQISRAVANSSDACRMTQPSVPGRVSCGPLEPPTLGRKSELWQVAWGKDQGPSSSAGIQAGRIGRGTLSLRLRVLAAAEGRIKGDSEESTILYIL